MTSVPSAPFGVITSPDGRRVFVSDSSGITVLRAGAVSPAVVGSVSLPGGQQGLGEALTPDGRYLLVAATSETAVLNVARLESGSAQAVVGSLPAPGGAIEVATSAGGRYVFTSLEGTGAIQVSDLARALSAGFRARGVTVGRVPAAFLPVGEAVSPDGRWLYATSEATPSAGASRRPVTGRPCPGDPDSAPGVVRIIGIAAAERDPATAVRATAAAGASPVRVVLSPGAAVAWVTARGSDALLGFATSRLTSARPALVTDVPVGSAPVGVVLVDGGRLAVVADSNRFAGRGPQWLGVVSIQDALHGRPALVGQIRAGSFPRQFALSPDGRSTSRTSPAANWRPSGWPAWSVRQNPARPSADNAGPGQQFPHRGHPGHGLIPAGRLRDQVELGAARCHVRGEEPGHVVGGAVGAVTLEPLERELVEGFHDRGQAGPGGLFGVREPAPHLHRVPRRTGPPGPGRLLGCHLDGGREAPG
jgi:DNA-binding beta-propeller fold protein YncE